MVLTDLNDSDDKTAARSTASHSHRQPTGRPMNHSTALHAVPRRALSDTDRLLPVRSFDAARIRGAVRELLLAIGEDPDREGLAGTPDRVARSYSELFGGLLEEPSQHLERTFSQDSEDLVVLRDIELTSCCEHHLLPVRGRASIAYLPADRRVVGLSKLARMVDGYARRPQLQERLTAQIADAIVQRLAPRGVSVLVEAEHACLALRGARKADAVMRTVAHRGCFAEHAELRLEALAMLGVTAPAATSSTLLSMSETPVGSPGRLPSP
jgi:GTP cyclohydrolase I